jgi:preprotein translocase subunit Sec61beta
MLSRDYYARTGRQAVNPLQRYERHRKSSARFLWAVGILVALLVAIFPWKDAFTIVTPAIVVLVALAVHLMLASDKAEN